MRAGPLANTLVPREEPTLKSTPDANLRGRAVAFIFFLALLFESGTGLSSVTSASSLDQFDWGTRAVSGESMVSPDPLVAFHGASPELVDRFEIAYERFVQAGLSLPELDVTFHDSGNGCGGNVGLHRTEAGVAYLDLCVPTNHLILHELAHAWETSFASEASRVAFLEYWDLQYWRNSEVEWHDRGAERAADAIAFALSAVVSDPAESLIKVVCGYPVITGMSLPAAWEPVVLCRDTPRP